MNTINELYKKFSESSHLVPYTKKSLPLNKENIETHVLTFLTVLGDLYLDKQQEKELKTAYMFSLKELLSLAYELHIDTIKSYNEIEHEHSLNHLFIKIYQDALKINQTYAFEDLQNCLEDFLALGFELGVSLEGLNEDYFG